MSGNANAITHFITLPFQLMKPLQKLGLFGSILLVTAIADAAIQYFVERDITTFQHYFAERNVKFLPAFRASKIANQIRSFSNGCLLGHLIIQIVAPKIIEKINDRIAIFSLGFGVWLPMIGCFPLPAFIIDQLNNFLIRNKNLGKNDLTYQNELKKVNISWDKPRYEYDAQWTTILQTTISIALAVFSDSKPFFAALAALSLYTFVQITKRDWLQITRIIDNIRYTYKPIFIMDATLKDDVCAVCQDIPSRKYYFCPNHSYDLSCLIRLFISATDYFKIQSIIQRSDPIEQMVVTVDANESIKPNCPTCRLPSSYNSLSMKVYDNGRWWDASINWIKQAPK